MSVFEYRDAFADTADVGSMLRHMAGPVCERPLVSISIPTFRRPELLLEAVESAMAQTGRISIEVDIVDNDPNPTVNTATITSLPAKPAKSLRYFVNDANVGMFPNWNRGIELARGEWVTVLNDDDVLSPDFVARMIALVKQCATIEGLVCRTGFLDRRTQPIMAQPPSLARKAWRWLTNRRYDPNGLARIDPRSLFFGNELSNSLGFLFRKDVAKTLGGFRPEDAPSADYLLYARFAARKGLFVLRDELAWVGIGENESLRPETVTGFMVQGDRLRRAMAGHYVPAHWLRMGPLITSTAVAESNAAWGVGLNPAEVGERLGMSLPGPSRTRLNLLRLLHRVL